MSTHKINQQIFEPKLIMNESIRIISAIRRSNLKLLRKIAEKNYLHEYSGTKYTNEMFCEFIGLKRSVYYQLLKKKTKPKFSEYYARIIEENAKLPDKWLDKKREDVEFNEIILEASKVHKIVRILLDFKKYSDLEIKTPEAEDRLICKAIEFTYHNDDINNDDLMNLLIK